MVKTSFVFLVCVLSGFLLTIQLIAFKLLIKQATVEEPTAWKILDQITVAAQQYKIPLFVIDQLLLNYIKQGDYLHTAKSWPKNYSSKNVNHHHFSSKRKFYSDFISYHQSSNSLLSRNRECRIFCRGESHLTHLATLADSITPETVIHFGNYLKDHHSLSVITLNDIDSSLLHLNLHVSIPTHIIIADERVDIRKQSHVVHIVILYDRVQGNNWWQAPVKLNEHHERILHRQGLKKTEFRLPYSSAIYDKTEIMRTTIDGLRIFLPHPPKSFLNPLNDKKFIECDRGRSNEFYSENPKDETLEANNFRKKAQTLLTKARQLIEHELGLPFWLSSGTLLGFYRQCDFIVYSGDVDIGMWADDFKPKIVDLFSINNIPLIHWFGRPNDSLELSFLMGDLKLDIFFFYREQDHYWNGGTQAKTGLKFKYDFPKFTLCWTDFIGLLVRIPCETESYIEANYGKQWRIPQRNWDWKSSPPNVQPNGQWDPNEWSETIRLIPMPNV
ncbi:hypothetical protein DERF_003082 [Dermatophagoides farinae]|uniref:Ribitol-5-phosphate transferase FKTN N-terminal domain-containing protein n=1 Tax=Dermatophagoides farinae TaxID=6954 RepID=A0A922IGY7_DERFA|nr:hypothetical protein DERF_003082 [Dermatophagoides farinae]